jgi:hypothetical protein
VVVLATFYIKVVLIYCHKHKMHEVIKLSRRSMELFSKQVTNGKVS